MRKIISYAIFYIFYVSIVLLHVLVINAKAEIQTGYFKGLGYTWKEARDSCKLAGLSDKIQVSNTSGKIGWVDASATYTPWVAYIRCYQVSQEFLKKHKSVQYGHQLQECLQFCKSFNYIGLQQDNCTCLNGVNSPTVVSACKWKTTETCKEDSFLYCANGQLDDFVIYKTGDIKEQFRPGNCLGVFISSNKSKIFQANYCENNLSSLCTTDSATVSSKFAGNNWTRSIELCNDHQLLSYDAYKKLNRIDEGNFWLANIRRPIFQEFVDSNPTYCVAAKIRDTNQVFPIVRPCTEKLSAICKDNDVRSSYETTSSIMVESSPGLEQKKKSTNDILLIVLIITAVLLVSIIIAVIILYKRRTSLRSRHLPLVVPMNEVTYAQVNKPTKEKAPDHVGEQTRENTADDTYDHMEHHRLSQNQIPTESNYDTMQSVGNAELENDYDVTSGTDRPRQIVVDDTAEYSHLEAVNQEVKDVAT